MEDSAALAYSSKLISQKLAQDLSTEKQLKEKLHDYESLARNLLEISKKSTHEVMVPLSDVGYFRGKVKHSNEVMVFLGDGYFVQRTAHECQPIIERRKHSKFISC